MTETRQYNSPARAQAKAATRAKIIDAVVRVVLDDGVHAFTVQNVAQKAGVSHRTVYRHFQTREDLLEGLTAVLDERASRAHVPTIPNTFDDVLEAIVPSFEAMGEQAEAVQAYVITSIALRWQDAGRKARTLAFERVTRNAFPNLSLEEVREVAAVVRSIASTRSWYQLTVEGGLDVQAAARASEWALRALFKDLSSRDRAAARRKNRS